MSAFVITEMCPDGPMRSLSVPTDAELTVRVEAADRALVVADGRTRERVTPPTNVRLTRADEKSASPARRWSSSPRSANLA